MIEFKKGNSEMEVDIELSKISNLGEVQRLMKTLLESKSSGESICISLSPPVNGKLSIPLVFKELVKNYVLLEKKGIKLLLFVQHEKIIDHLIKFLPQKEQPTVESKIGEIELYIQLGDIVVSKVNAIVNASNNKLKLGGGVSGAIREAANSDIQIQLDRIAKKRTINSGDAIITESFGIRGIEKIIHVSSVEGSEGVIRNCLRNTFRVCEENRIRSLAIPALGAGTGGLSIDKCAEIFVSEIIDCYGMKPKPKLEIIKIILWTKQNFDIFKREVEQI